VTHAERAVELGEEVADINEVEQQVELGASLQAGRGNGWLCDISWAKEVATDIELMAACRQELD
jgi:hypothetical protein